MRIRLSMRFTRELNLVPTINRLGSRLSRLSSFDVNASSFSSSSTVTPRTSTRLSRHSVSSANTPAANISISPAASTLPLQAVCDPATNGNPISLHKRARSASARVAETAHKEIDDRYIAFYVTGITASSASFLLRDLRALGVHPIPISSSDIASGCDVVSAKSDPEPTRATHVVALTPLFDEVVEIVVHRPAARALRAAVAADGYKTSVSYSPFSAAVARPEPARSRALVELLCARGNGLGQAKESNSAQLPKGAESWFRAQLHRLAHVAEPYLLKVASAQNARKPQPKAQVDMEGRSLQVGKMREFDVRESELGHFSGELTALKQRRIVSRVSGRLIHLRARWRGEQRQYKSRSMPLRDHVDGLRDPQYPTNISHDAILRDLFDSLCI